MVDIADCKNGKIIRFKPLLFRNGNYIPFPMQDIYHSRVWIFMYIYKISFHVNYALAFTGMVISCQEFSLQFTYNFWLFGHFGCSLWAKLYSNMKNNKTKNYRWPIWKLVFRTGTFQTEIFSFLLHKFTLSISSCSFSWFAWFWATTIFSPQPSGEDVENRDVLLLYFSFIFAASSKWIDFTVEY